MSQVDAIEDIRAILNRPRKVKNDTNRWNCKGRRRTESSVWGNGTKYIKRDVQCSFRRDPICLKLLPGNSCSISSQDSPILSTNKKPQAPCHNKFKAVITIQDVIVICRDPFFPQFQNIRDRRIGTGCFTSKNPLDQKIHKSSFENSLLHRMH